MSMDKHGGKHTSRSGGKGSHKSYRQSSQSTKSKAASSIKATRTSLINKAKKTWNTAKNAVASAPVFDSNVIQATKTFFTKKSQTTRNNLPRNSKYPQTPVQNKTYNNVQNNTPVFNMRRNRQRTMDSYQPNMRNTNEPVYDRFDFRTRAKFNFRAYTTSDPEEAKRLQKYYVTPSYIHDPIIAQGNRWLSEFDSKGHDWILQDYDPELSSEGDRQAVEQRTKYWNNYIKKYIKKVNTYDPDKDIVEEEFQIAEDAPLPPWIKPTETNINTWAYFTQFSHDTVEEAVRAYSDAVSLRPKHKVSYKSAFSSEKERGEIDSFFDIIISSVSSGNINPITALPKALGSYGRQVYESGKLVKPEFAGLNNGLKYLKDYYYEPLKEGQFKTVIGNTLWNVMDTMDFAARGVRALAAGETALGGTTESGHVFEGQKTWWASVQGYSDSDVKHAQKVFLQNGGAELLKGGSFTSMKDGFQYNSHKALQQHIEQVFKEKGINVPWYEVYKAIKNGYYKGSGSERMFDSIKQGWENIKLTYTDPDATFDADTGNLAKDLVINMVLDPGLVVGGMSKGIVKSGVKSAAELSVRDGLKAVAKSSDDVEKILKNKGVRKAFKAFIRFNEGKHIIFKDINKIDEELISLTAGMRKADSSIFKVPGDEEAFRNVVANSLLGKSTEINGEIISSTLAARKSLDNKIFKYAYKMDHAIDDIDATILKASFAAPWAFYKGAGNIRKIGNILPKDVRKYINIKKAKRATMGKLVVDESTNKVDVTKLADVMNKHDANLLDEQEVKKTLAPIKEAFNKGTKRVLNMVADLDDEVSDEALVKQISEICSDISGGKCTSVDELAQYIPSDVRYADDIANAFNQFDNAVKVLGDISQGKAVNQRLTGEAVEAGVKAAKQVSRAERRTVDIDTFKKMVEDAGFDGDPEAPIAGFIAAWDDRLRVLDKIKDPEKRIGVEWNVTDLIGEINKMAGKYEYKTVIDKKVISSTSGIVANSYVGPYQKLIDSLKQLDVVSVQDNEVITLAHIDRMTMFDKYSESEGVTSLLQTFHRDVIAPFIDEVSGGKTLEDVELADSPISLQLRELDRIQSGFIITKILKQRIQKLGYSNNKIQSIMTGLANNFGCAGKLHDLTASPNILRKNVEATLKAQSGRPKFNISGIVDSLKTITSDTPDAILKPYADEIKSDPDLLRTFNEIVNSDISDPMARNDIELLYSLLAQPGTNDVPSFARELNEALNAGHTPIFIHQSTTGLNNEIHEITSFAYRKWTGIDDPDNITFSKIAEIFKDDSSKGIIKRGMTDEELSCISEQVIRRLDMKGVPSSKVLDELKKTYGITADNPHKSEEELLEEVINFINSNTVNRVIDGGLQPSHPKLVVHDLDGFNISFINSRIKSFAEVRDSSSVFTDYTQRLASELDGTSVNTYKRLANRYGDDSITDEEIKEVVELLFQYDDEILTYSDESFDFMNYRSYYQKLRSAVDEANLRIDAGEGTDLDKRFVQAFDDNDGDKKLGDYLEVLEDMSKLSTKPREYAFIQRAGDVNLSSVSPGIINNEARIYVSDIESYFDIATDTGLAVNLDEAESMNRLAKYVINKRDGEIVRGAEEFLSKYKSNIDTVIKSVSDMVRVNSFASSDLSYIGKIKIPNTAVESYLVLQKLYDGVIKYWLDNDLVTSFKTEGADIDFLKKKLRSIGYSYGFESPKFRLESHKVFNSACDYVNGNRTRLFTELWMGDDFNPNLIVDDNFDEILNLLEGAHRPEIFKTAARSDYEKTILRNTNNNISGFKQELDLATAVGEANSELTSGMRQLDSFDNILVEHGIENYKQRFIGVAFQKTKQLFDNLSNTRLAKRESFRTLMKAASNGFDMKLQQSRLNRLRNADGLFDTDKLVNELATNGFNCVVYNTHNYSVEDMRQFREFVESVRKEYNFIDYYEDTSKGNVWVSLNNNCIRTVDGDSYFINVAREYKRIIYEAVTFPEFDELVELTDIEDIEDFREVYNMLQECWAETRQLSYGKINGTTGRLVTRAEADEFIKTIPPEIANNMLSPKGLLVSDINRDMIFDPGFVHNTDSDMLMDFMGVIKQQINVAKEDAMLINEIFLSGRTINFRALVPHFTDEELMNYFDGNSDYVVAALVPDKNTRTGLAVRRLRVDNRTSLEAAKELENTTILPYDAYFEIAGYMNRAAHESQAKKMLSTFLWVYKAFALVKPGTWMRNYIDATLKASFDNGEGASNIFNIINYEGKAVRDINTYTKIMKSNPTALTKGNWDTIQKVYKTDMTYEDFEVLKGVMDSAHYITSDQYFTKHAGQAVVSGEQIGLRNMDEKSINKIYDQCITVSDRFMKKEEFMDIYFHKVEPDYEMSKKYEEMMRIISNKFRTMDARNRFEKGVDMMFKPFARVEEIVRYAQTLQLLDMGMSQNQITKRIHATQFYSAPSWGTFNKLETIMPFVTYKYNNAMYWIRMMDENPRLYRYFEDIYGTIANQTIENAIDQDREIDYVSDYNLQTGGIPLGNSNAYFKLNPSVLSFLEDFYGGPGTLIDAYTGGLNPVLKEGLRYSLYNLGYSSSKFFSDVELDVTKDPTKEMANLIPGLNLGLQVKDFLFEELPGIMSKSGGLTMDVIWSALSFSGVIGLQKDYGGSVGFAEWMRELEAQGKWYDANTGEIKNISERNYDGANSFRNTFEDIETYRLIHFGEVWDANKGKFVPVNELSYGMKNQIFDFKNDPYAWENLQRYMKTYYNKVYDYNQKKFVPYNELTEGGLNDPNITWEERCMLMEEKFGLKWDGNQNEFVTSDSLVAGGLNNKFDFKKDRTAWPRLQGYRYAMFGETYDKTKHKFEKTDVPKVVVYGGKNTNEEHEYEYDNYFSQLGLIKPSVAEGIIKLDKEGFLIDEKGRYIVFPGRDADNYNQRVFGKFQDMFAYTGSGYGRRRTRSYGSWKNYSYGKSRVALPVKTPKTHRPAFKPSRPEHRIKKPYYKDRFYTGFGWNDKDAYYRLNYSFNYQYHNPQPASALHRLFAPRINYPYGNGMRKFSFHTR